MNSIIFIKKLIYLIFKTKKRFFKPRQAEILLYDQGNQFNSIVKKYFKTHNISILYARLEEINLYVVYRIFLSLKILNSLSLFENYILEYCRLSGTKTIISSTLWDEKILSLKERKGENFKIILVQAFPIKKFYFKNLKKKKFKIYFFFVFDQKSKNILKKFFTCEFKIIGSFKNNFFVKKNYPGKKKILLISGFKKIFIDDSDQGAFSLNAFHEKKIIILLDKIFNKKNNLIYVLLKPDVQINDYKKFVGFKKNFIINNIGNPYHIMDKFDLIITATSTTSMGLEALSRGIKFVEIPREKSKNYFYVYKKKIDEPNLKKFVNTYYKISNKKYFSMQKKIKEKQSLKFDNNNKEFKKTLNQIILNFNQNKNYDNHKRI